MFLVKNIINSLTSDEFETALVVCEARQDYAIDLCKVFKKVFFYSPFSDPHLPSNAYIIHNVNAGVLQTSFDIIISIGEGQSASIGSEISKKLHAPLLQINKVNDLVGVSRPFSTPPASFARHESSLEISMYPFVKSSSNICIPHIRNEIVDHPKDLSYVGLVPAPEMVISKYLGLLNDYPIKVMQGVDPSCGVLIDTWLGNSPHLLNYLNTGAIVICPRCPDSEELIQEGVNGFLYKDFKELSRVVKYVYSNMDSMQQVSKEAQKLYLSVTLDSESFINKWQDVIQNIVRKV